MSELPLPKLAMPIPELCHPEVADVERTALEWIGRRDVSARTRQRLANTRSGLLISRIAPFASRGMLDCMTQLMIWGIWFDDEFADAMHPESPYQVPAVTSVMGMLNFEKGSGAAGTPLEVAWAEIISDLVSLCTHFEFDRWRTETRNWLMGTVLQSRLRLTEEPPSLVTYTATRFYAVGCTPWIVLSHASRGRELTWEDYTSPESIALRTHATNVVAWQNDIFSLFAESEHPGVFWNLPAVFQAQGAGIEEAAQASAEMANQAMASFNACKAEYAAVLSEPARLYVESCEHVMRGAYDWSHEIADRYHGWSFAANRRE